MVGEQSGCIARVHIVDKKQSIQKLNAELVNVEEQLKKVRESRITVKKGRPAAKKILFYQYLFIINNLITIFQFFLNIKSLLTIL